MTDDSRNDAVEAVDHVLSTTRAVRLRLDLDRDVDIQIVYDCIDVAEQAPTGGNQGSRRWVVVRDPALKARLAELYNEAAGSFMTEAYQRLAGTGHPQERVMASAAHLAEHLAEVPLIVIPTIVGRHDDSGRPGLFDSVIQSAWSFCVALRARGLGSAWTTAVLAKDAELKELLDIPDHMTEIAMLPVAWTKGTEFKRAPRYPARAITFVDGFARTYEFGPSDPIGLADGPGTVVETDIAGPVGAVWEKVTDIDLPARFSDEFLGATWVDGADGAALGASFVGRNQHSAIGEWDVPCFVDRFEDQRLFGWRTSDRDNPGARWLFELEPIAGAVRLRFSVSLGPGPSGVTAAVERQPDKESRIIDRRMAEHRTNMQRVVDGIRDAVEAAL